jgi:hypothetical protein
MDSRRLRRAALALIAAYVVALQALFAAFVPMPPVSMAVLCSGNAPDGYPAQHEAPCADACAALGQGAGAPPPPATTVAITTPAPVQFVALDGRIALVAILGPQAPRGPPLA